MNKEGGGDSCAHRDHALLTQPTNDAVHRYPVLHAFALNNMGALYHAMSGSSKFSEGFHSEKDFQKALWWYWGSIGKWLASEAPGSPAF